ncbi:hypothetical protein EPA93_35720 [Ktedonosporobacter rubrisoli]|uniref:ORC1/DEAH AAA+ ATPase domain-containing protein n=1 Tax=Ktedonosporobacter rubrisoli TaxID=2509675 RepID=A0A4P6JZ80_KTERU|nr:AAA family ATPase [Ktedonosporobacter rubrisoli]QBD81034.1 hypothetical protein EPA93_35720 [Ktedonosporobacter rubrisoli]
MMPKLSAYRVAWNPRSQCYDVCSFNGKEYSVLPFTPGSSAWFDWLATITSFSFSSRHGARCTVRKESARRGGEYWSAYHRQRQKMLKRYLGRAANLTLAQLEEVALLLSPEPRSSVKIDDSSPGAARSPRPGREPAGANYLHNDLLEARLQMPHLPATLLMRPHLVAQVQEGLQRALTLVCAPAGFGKTTALLTWAKAHPEQRIAWVSLDRLDNDPIQFWTYVLSALQRTWPQIGTSLLAWLRSPQSPPLSAVLRHLLNALASVQEKLVLVLDDYHLITAAAVHQTLSTLLEHQPAALHLVLLTRQQPPLPLAHLRAQGHLYEIGPRSCALASLRLCSFFKRRASLYQRRAFSLCLSVRKAGLLVCNWQPSPCKITQIRFILCKLFLGNISMSWLT